MDLAARFVDQIDHLAGVSEYPVADCAVGIATVLGSAGLGLPTALDEVEHLL